MGPAEEIQELHTQDADAGITDLWMVCFTGRDEEYYWWDRFRLTDKDFRHCYVLQYQAFTNHWVLLDWRTGNAEIMIFRPDEMVYIFNQLEASGGTGVMFRTAVLEREIHYRIPLIYCVQAVLQVIGLPTKWTFTPKQLYNRLIAEGGEELLNYRSEPDGRIKRKRQANQGTEGTQQAAEGHQRDHAATT